VHDRSSREKGIGIRLGRPDPIDQTICVVGAEERGRGLLFFLILQRAEYFFVVFFLCR
jgi:hypothetical protein